MMTWRSNGAESAFVQWRGGRAGSWLLSATDVCRSRPCQGATTNIGDGLADSLDLSLSVSSQSLNVQVGTHGAFHSYDAPWTKI